MNYTMVKSNTKFNRPPEYWVQELQSLAYAQSKPLLSGDIKVQPNDFVVTELMDVVPSGEGEHYWLDVSKIQCNTDTVAKQIARFSGVSHRDIGYSGLKDFNAETRQWFSVWKPKGGEPDWPSLKIPGVCLNQVVKHHRKIKRGTHRANRFAIKVRNLEGSKEALEQRLMTIKKEGVPNYFGVQRFGRNAENMNKAVALFDGQESIKNRNLKSIVLSAARSWLFNTVVSARVTAETWQRLCENEPANLNASNSLFISEGGDDELGRLLSHDIHPTAPMWGGGAEKVMDQCFALADWEADVLKPYGDLQSGLESVNMDYQRRSIRCSVGDLMWQFVDDGLLLTFELQRGQFATSVLREVVNV